MLQRFKFKSLYSSVANNFKFFFGLFLNRSMVGPHTVMLDIEDDCDLHCNMCFYHSPFIEEKLEQDFTRLGYSTIKSLLFELSRMGTRKITICGKGEPFLHPDILKIIELIKSKGFYLNIFTNGIHIDRKILDTILENKVDQITFSLHAGDIKTYLKVHPEASNGTFKGIIDILEKINFFKNKNKAYVPYIKIINVIYKSNYKNVDKMMNLAEEYANEILFKPVILYEEQKKLSLDFEKKNFLKKSLENLDCEINNNIKSYLDYLNTSKFLAGRKSKTEENISKKCFVPFYQTSIMTNGDVVGCAYNQKVIGNVKEEKISSIWHSDKYQNFRRNLDCNDCKGKVVYPFLKNFIKYLI